MEKAICLLEMCKEIWRHQIALKCIKGYMDTRREDAPQGISNLSNLLSYFMQVNGFSPVWNQNHN